MQSDASVVQSGLGFQNKFLILTLLVWASWLALLFFVLADAHAPRLTPRVFALLAHPLPWITARRLLDRIARENSADIERESHTVLYVLVSAYAALWLAECALYPLF